MEIKSDDDLEKILNWIEANTQLNDPRFYRFLFQKLYANGRCESAYVDTLIQFVSKKNFWSDEANAETGILMSTLRDRFASRIRWINKVLGREDSPYRDSLAIIYDRSSSRYQMVIDPEKVVAFRGKQKERKKPGVEVDVHAEELLQGDPKLYSDSELRFSIRSSISGFVHIFHADSNGLIDKLFPELESGQYLKVSRGKDMLFPDAVSDLCAVKHWRIGKMDKAEVKQKLLVLVTGENVDVTTQDSFEYFNLKAHQEKAIFIEKKRLSDLVPSQKLSSIVEYWLESS